MPGESDQDVFIKIHGSDEAGGDNYKTTLYFCSSGTTGGYEILTVNKSTGTFTTTDVGSEGGASKSSSVTAYLTVDGSGNIIFDKSKSRSATSTYYQSGGNIFKGDVTITATDLIYAKRYFSSVWGVNRNYSISGFTGSSFDNLRFTEAGYTGKDQRSGSGSHNYAGSAVFNSTHYTTDTSNALYSEVSGYDFTADSFFTSISAPTVDTSGYSCSATPDAEVTMDFSNSDVQAIQTACEADRFDNYTMCWGSAIQNASSTVFTSQAY